ncbi:D-isomer specific 2-hydroxyacid dehydrogenase NAD-binding [Penicillium odoratum]|uniref:D-isomer specific 2-hydroxyacid dehydrogenase NAD-binding n=1 Tax=Penicillium odoratum TaxID=1167516 RepID=UPI0025496286|nr:D-isomer specific 2-hydroxyacid dehydrogenase NAD-binding [Penicillium odoratum]KAJ5765780.1 D-isomer specific 2-hydroxyacid dehydrogenase NAD-binding [Penicillium odoratum]
MGDAPLPSEHVLIILNYTLPDSLLEAIRQKFADAEVTLYSATRGAKVPPELFRKATILVTFIDLPEPEDAENLKFVHTFSAGLDHLMNNPLLKSGAVPFTTSSGIHGPPIAEWTIMNWLVSARKYSIMYEAQKEHKWDKETPWMQTNYDQAGKKVGILGYGSIGRQIARVSQALGMTVHAYTASPRPTPESRHDNGFIVPGTGDPDGSIPVSWHHGTEKSHIHEFLSLGLDHLVVSVPLTPQTTHMLGAEEFALLSENSKNPGIKPYVTNISRGKVLNQDALIEALKSGQLGGAALDVTDPEPLPADHPLWDAPNVQISPHISGSGREYFWRSIQIVRINLDRLANGQPLINKYGGKGY